MHDNVFIDTNLWIYLFTDSENPNDKTKKTLVIELLKKNPNIIISIQVLNEIVNVLSKKFKLSSQKIIEILNSMKNSLEIKLLFEENIIHSLELMNNYSLSYYDALIISVALKSNCTLLYTEDIQHN